MDIRQVYWHAEKADMGEVRWFPISGPFPAMAFQEDIDLLERYQRFIGQSMPVELAYSGGKRT